MSEFRLFHLPDCPTKSMPGNRGEQVPLIDGNCGAKKIDVHFNRLAAGEPGGLYHFHTNSDNVYIVKSGKGQLIVEDNEYIIGEDDIIYIPAGQRHSLKNASSSEPFEIFEIYTPAGKAFDFIVDGRDIGIG